MTLMVTRRMVWAAVAVLFAFVAGPVPAGAQTSVFLEDLT